MRTGGSSFRRAVAASVGLHALLAAAIVFGRWGEGRPEAPRQPGIDTRTEVRVHFADIPREVIVEGPVVAPPESAPVSPPAPEAVSRDDRPPLVRSMPMPPTLPRELLVLLRRPHPENPAPAGPAEPPPAPATPIRPAGGTAPRSPEGRTGSAKSIHGTLAAGQSIVYVLDASGSMGEWGKFDRARRSLVATLRSQPETVRFQVVVYSGSAEFPLRIHGHSLIPATPDFVDRLEVLLESLGPPAGRSSHIAALRAALELEPDVVLILSDATTWPPGSVRTLLRTSPRTKAAYIAKVRADRVEMPLEVK